MKKLQKGQTMIEAIVALMTILLIITAIAVVITNGLYNSQFIKNQNEANKYAQQGMELVRNIQQNDLEEFSQPNFQNTTLCIDENTQTLIDDSQICAGINTGKYYNRTITFSQGAEPCVGIEPTGTALAVSETKVTVTVAWSSSKCDKTNTFCHKSVLQACLPDKLSGSNI
jgi:Tfp pilus assembly protein PilV